MSHITEQKCPNCGAPMHFDPASGMLVCDNCGNKVDVSEKPSGAAAATPPEESEFAGLDFNMLQAQAIDPDAEDLPIYTPTAATTLSLRAKSPANSAPTA